jgi:hypothetical protein
MNPIHMKKLCLASLLAANAALVGCVHQEPDRVRADFAQANRAMLLGQLYDLNTSLEPSSDTPVGLDGQKASGAIRAYRADTSNRDFSDAGVSTNSVTQTGN